MFKPTVNEAKKQVKGWLRDHGLPDYRLSAKSVGFSDLARDSMVFVTVHGWQPHPGIPFDSLSTWAREQGFRVETDGNYSG